jgi:hypothetical protein
VVIEYFFVLLFCVRRLKPMPPLLFWTVVINLITNPASQCGAYYLTDPNLISSETAAWGAIAAIEAIVVVVEYFLFRLVFKRLSRLGKIEQPLSPKRTLVMVLVANTVSFALPALLFISMGPWT